MVPFQFHKGAIRTVCRSLPGVPVPGFQFHKGAIRTIKKDGWLNYFSKFQFHKGAIRTEDLEFDETPEGISIP